MAAALRTVVLDNGSGSLKAGFAGEARPRAVLPNAVGRAKRGGGLLAGDDAETLVRDPSQLTWLRPAERGLTNDPLVQSLVWERALSGAHLDLPDAGGHALLLSAPAFMPAPLEATLDELVFEQFGFAALTRVPAARMTAWAAMGGTLFAPPPPNTAGAARVVPPSALPFSACGVGLVVDAGYSCTTITPVSGWAPVPDGIRRLDVGGKAMTHALREAVSYRQFNMMDDTWLVNRVKERLCFVAQVYDAELELARRLSAPGALARAARARAAGGMPAAPRSQTAATDTAAAAAAGAARGRGVYHAPKTADVGGAGAAGGAPLQPPTTYAHARPPRGSDGDGVGIRREYVLPDFVAFSAGFVRGDPALDPYVAARRALAEAEAAGLGAGTSGVHAAVGEAAAVAAGSSALVTGGDSAPAPAGGGAAGRKRPRPVAAPTAGALSGTGSSGVGSGGGSHATAKRRAGTGVGKAGAAKAGAADAASASDVDMGGDDKEGGAGDGDDEDDDEDDEEEDDDNDASSSDSDGRGNYKGKSTAGTGGKAAAAPPPPQRTVSRRAASAGVSALTSSLKREGIIAEGEDDEDGGGATATAAAEPVTGKDRYATAMGRGGGCGGGGGGGGEARLVTASGTVLPPESDLQALVLAGERMAPGELLFQPWQGGLAGQAGLAEAVVQAIAASPAALRPLLWASIVVTGGCARMPGLEARLARELRPLAPVGVSVRTFTPSDPVVAAWAGGAWAASQPWFADGAPPPGGGPAVPRVTKAQWEEEGERACRRAFRVRSAAGGAANADEARDAEAGGRGGSGDGGGGGKVGGVPHHRGGGHGGHGDRAGHRAPPLPPTGGAAGSGRRTERAAGLQAAAALAGLR